MSDRSEKFYEKLENIRDEYIEKADEPINKEIHSKESLYKGKEGDVIEIHRSSKKYIKFIYIAAAIIIIIILGIIIKNNMVSQKDKLEEKTGDEKNTSSPAPTNVISDETSKLGTYKYPVSDDVKNVDMFKMDAEYLFKIEPDINWVIDLNGDGKEELICYKKVESENGYVGCIYINNAFSFKITSKYLGDIYFNDLYSGDKIYNIAVQESEDNVNFTTNYYEWNSEKLIEVGYMWNTSNNISEWKFNMDNTPGLVYAKANYNEYCTTFSVFSLFQYNKDEQTFDNKCEEENEIVDLLSGKTKLEMDMDVYSEPNENSSKKVMKAQNVEFTKVRFLENSFYNCWLYTQGEDGTSGWILLKHNLSGEQADENTNLLESRTQVDLSINGELSAKYFKSTKIYQELDSREE